mgnify:CR=1 FL=1
MHGHAAGPAQPPIGEPWPSTLARVSMKGSMCMRARRGVRAAHQKRARDLQERELRRPA